MCGDICRRLSPIIVRLYRTNQMKKLSILIALLFKGYVGIPENVNQLIISS
jgi:hypothetical protein